MNIPVPYLTFEAAKSNIGKKKAFKFLSLFLAENKIMTTLNLKVCKNNFFRFTFEQKSLLIRIFHRTGSGRYPNSIPHLQKIAGFGSGSGSSWNTSRSKTLLKIYWICTVPVMYLPYRSRDHYLPSYRNLSFQIQKYRTGTHLNVECASKAK